MKYITTVETSILSSIEPLTVMVISVIIFGTSLGYWQLVGVFVMLVCVTWLSIEEKKHKNTIFTGDYYYIRVIGNLFLGQGGRI
ncbi:MULTISPECIES: hypothetical protein [Lysinibacillus]|uniref:EamA domain-containing protein n=1 Tax=Lysinibacillus xylanilyticus TaxID=582475 RepID=A0ABV3VW31_9BACI